MSKFNKFLLNTIICIFSTVTFMEAAETQVYSWRSENGSTVLSEKKPSDDIEYKIIEVRNPTVVDTKNPQDAESDNSVEIGQSDVKKLADSQLAEKNKDALKEGNEMVFSVKIISPSTGANIFTKEQELPIITNPTIPKNDSPTFIINGSSIPASYSDTEKTWVIARPTPGESKLTISGKTADGNDIESTNIVTFNARSGWLQQLKNTGNYHPIKSSS